MTEFKQMVPGTEKAKYAASRVVVRIRQAVAANTRAEPWPRLRSGLFLGLALLGRRPGISTRSRPGGS
jgi:hypothetical protein